MALRTCRLACLIVLAAATSCGLELKQQTTNAWNSYLSQETARINQRIDHPAEFFWVDQNPGRMKCLRAGEILVAPFETKNPVRIQGGLIHHWIAAVFIPDATVNDILAVTRDYRHYKDYYNPGVSDALLIAGSKNRDEFTIRFANQSVLSNTSLEGRYVSDFTRLTDVRWYSVSQTTSMREIKYFGKPNEKIFPAGQGSGYIWRLYSTARMENRDSGVILELEAIALSRDIPIAMRWLVDPIVRRISSDSIQKSLTETSVAVRERLKKCKSVSRIAASSNCPMHDDQEVDQRRQDTVKSTVSRSTSTLR